MLLSCVRPVCFITCNPAPAPPCLARRHQPQTCRCSGNHIATICNSNHIQVVFPPYIFHKKKHEAAQLFTIFRKIRNVSWVISVMQMQWGKPKLLKSCSPNLWFKEDYIYIQNGDKSKQNPNYRYLLLKSYGFSHIYWIERAWVHL